MWKWHEDTNLWLSVWWYLLFQISQLIRFMVVCAVDQGYGTVVCTVGQGYWSLCPITKALEDHVAFLGYFCKNYYSLISHRIVKFWILVHENKYVNSFTLCKEIPLTFHIIAGNCSYLVMPFSGKDYEAKMFQRKGGGGWGKFAEGLDIFSVSQGSYHGGNTRGVITECVYIRYILSHGGKVLPSF
jgi:hypothetical protein